jgi:hypothetical protein
MMHPAMHAAATTRCATGPFTFRRRTSLMHSTAAARRAACPLSLSALGRGLFFLLLRLVRSNGSADIQHDAHRSGQRQQCEF